VTTGLEDARRAARTVGAAMARATEDVPLVDAAGRVLAADVVAATRLPVTDTAAMDGWAVAGAGPWRVDGAVRMGQPPGTLADGLARVVTTGGALPTGARAVLRAERGVEHAGVLSTTVDLPDDHDVRCAGTDVSAGAVVAGCGARVTPAVLAAAAAAGIDAVRVAVPPRVLVVLVGDELVVEGVPAPGQVRDALGVALPPALRAGGAEVVALERVADDVDAVRRAVDRADVDLVVTAAATGHGASDHLPAALEACGCRQVFRGVAMRPGHPVLLACRGDGVPVLGLPGNPFAAVVAATLIGLPLLAGALGAAPPRRRRRVAAHALPGAEHGVRVLAVREEELGVVAVPQGSSVVSGAVDADQLAIVPPGGLPAGSSVDVVDLPWRR